MADDAFGWKVAEWFWRNRDEVLGYLKRVRDWFRSDPGGRSILIIGPGGVGKTTLAGLLSGTFDWLLSEPWRYDESYGVEEANLKDDPKVNIVIPPGQHTRRDATWGSIGRDLASGKHRGVILVNANGYHTLPSQSYKAHGLYKGNKEAFLAAYLQACREQELEVLRRVAAAIRSASGRVWLLTAVAKEDLWWPDRQQAAAFYANGEYATTIGSLAAAKGQETFRHEVITASLVIGNFLSGENEVLAKNTEGYDHRQQIESVRRLFELLAALRDWESP